MKSYYRLMLGKGSSQADECLEGEFIGTDFGIHQDLNGKLPDQWREFNKLFIPVYLEIHPDKTKISAGLACGALWTVSKGINIGDLVLCPDGSGRYRVGEVLGDYYYAADTTLPHRRKVRWMDSTVDRTEMSSALKNSSGSIGTICNLSSYKDEIESLVGPVTLSSETLLSTDDAEIEDPVAFALEKHLEDFLVKNWSQVELSSEFEVYADDGELVGQQYPTDAGPIDILAVSKDRKRLLVLELKRGRASDVVVGQVLRYMGFLKEQVAENDQTVEGVIIALEDDQKLRWALMSVPSISFYRYQVKFKLVKA